MQGAGTGTPLLPSNTPCYSERLNVYAYLRAALAAAPLPPARAAAAGAGAAPLGRDASKRRDTSAASGWKACAMKDGLGEG